MSRNRLGFEQISQTTCDAKYAFLSSLYLASIALLAMLTFRSLVRRVSRDRGNLGFEPLEFVLLLIELALEGLKGLTFRFSMGDRRLDG